MGGHQIWFDLTTQIFVKNSTYFHHASSEDSGFLTLTFVKDVAQLYQVSQSDTPILPDYSRIPKMN
jgi:hypothetical protein